jgi:hypothetical protein
MPAVADDFFCPAVVPLRANLNLAPHGQGLTAGQQNYLQAYFDNLKTIRNAYQGARRNAVKNELANCMLIHLASLYDNRSLLAPTTQTDAATWLLLQEEALEALNTVDAKYLRTKYEAALVAEWLNTLPRNIAVK